MRIGIELADEHRHPRPSAVAGMARAAEGLGYATVWVRDGSAPVETVDLLAVAAGATAGVGLGVEATTASIDRVVAELEARRGLFADRLHVAVPATVTAADLDRLRARTVRATILVDPQVDRGAFDRDVDGYFVGDPSSVIEQLASVDLEVVVRLPVLTGVSARAIEQLHDLHAGGADEVVLAAVDEPDVDRALAVYAALAEAVEQAV